MVSKKLSIIIILSTVILLLSILIPSLLFATDNDSPTATRLYADSLEGPWNSTPTPATRWVAKTTLVNGQKTIYVQEVSFMWEAPAGTLVFFAGSSGDTGPQGPQGPRGPQGASGVRVFGLIQK
jgi:hypothetical protein